MPEDDYNEEDKDDEDVEDNEDDVYNKDGNADHQYIPSSQPDTFVTRIRMLTLVIMTMKMITISYYFSRTPL